MQLSSQVLLLTYPIKGISLKVKVVLEDLNLKSVGPNPMVKQSTVNPKCLEVK